MKIGAGPPGPVHIFENNFVNYGSARSAHGLIWDKDNRGNYYSDFLDRYPTAQEHKEFNGIWDTPLVFPNGDKDNFPLMNRIHHDTVITAPPTPVLETPCDETTGISIDTTLSWYPSSEATSYRLQVSSDSTERQLC